MMQPQDLAARATGGKRSLAALDAAAAYLRLRAEVVLPQYLLAAAPTALCGLFAVDALTARDARGAPMLALGLAGATLWRWIFLAPLQAGVMRDLGMRTAPLARRLPAFLFARLCAFTLLTWGGLFIVPAFYGSLLAGMAGPLTLDGAANPWTSARRALGWTHGSFRYLSRFLTFFSLFMLMLFVAVLGLQGLTLQVLPPLIGADTQELELTLSSSGWFMAVLLLIGGLADLFFTVAGVFLHHDLCARHHGADLLARLRGMDPAQGGGK